MKDMYGNYFEWMLQKTAKASGLRVRLCVKRDDWAEWATFIGGAPELYADDEALLYPVMMI